MLTSTRKLALLLTCPECGAKSEELCVGRTGKPRERMHAKRQEGFAWHVLMARARPRKRWRARKDGRRLLEAALGRPCPLCGRPLFTIHLMQLDHVVPLGIGGRDEVANLRVLCAQCNSQRPRNGSDIDVRAGDLEVLV